MSRPTIRDVAKEAGVGVGTVSRVLNGSLQVSEETRQRVLAAVDELNYMPHAAAQQLKRGKTLIIGILTPFYTLPSFVERLAGVHDVLHESNYDPVLYSTRSPQYLAHRLSELLTQRRVDGLIILSPPRFPDDLWNLSPDLPIVVVDNHTSGRYPSITVDNVKGGEIATEYLLSQGHTQIGYIGDQVDPRAEFFSSQQRFEGLQNTLKKAGIGPVQKWYRFGLHGRDFAYGAAREMLSVAERPTAIFAASDLQAFGVLMAARDLGLSVPEDIAVIGFDDIETAQYMQLTTVRQPLYESGRLSAQQILDWLDPQQVNPEICQQYLPLELVKRETA